MIGFVYLWYDSGRNSEHAPNVRRWCLGSHRGDENDGYTTGTGGRYFKAAYRKRPQDFKRRVIERIHDGTAKDVYAAEQRWLNLIRQDELGKRYYNNKKTALGVSREDMARFHEADPTLISRRAKAIKLAYSDPIVRKRRSEAMSAIYADPELRKRVGQAVRSAHAADPTRSQRLSEIFKAARIADPTIKQRQAATYKANCAANPEVGQRISAGIKAAHAADPAIAKRMAVNIKAAYARKTAEERSEIARKIWISRRANATPERIKARCEKMWATRRAKAAKIVSNDV